MLPDYPNDISAAYELEDSIPEDQRIGYLDKLFEILDTDLKELVLYDGVYWASYKTIWAIAHATPEQRCRAYIAWTEKVKAGEG